MTVVDTLTVRLGADPTELEQALRRLGKVLAKAFAEIDKSLTPLKIAFDEYEKGIKSSEVSAAGFDKANKNLKQTFFDTEAALKDLKTAFGDAFVDAIVEGKKFSDVLKELEKDIIRLIARRFVADQLGDAVVGLFGSLLGGLFGGGRQHGGRVSPHKAFLVGEKGPELFVPPGVGEIVSDRQLVRGNTTVVINQQISVAPDVSAVARAEIVRQLPMIRAYAAQGITDARLRGRLPA
jgi:hypothetical protein